MNSVRGRCTNAALSPFPRLYSTVTLSKRETSPRIHPSGTTGRSIKTADRPSERFEFEFQSIRFDRIAILSANKRETRWNWPFWRTVSGNAKWFLIFSSDTWTYKGVRGSLSSLSLNARARQSGIDVIPVVGARKFLNFSPEIYLVDVSL